MSSNKIIRTASEVKGGITSKELEAMKKHNDIWIQNILRTKTVDVAEITEAIENLYTVSELKKPKVIVVPSPLCMVFTYGAAAAILYKNNFTKTNQAIHRAIDLATYQATKEATYRATREAIKKATYEAIDRATYGAIHRATYEATDEATNEAIHRATYEATYGATDEATREAIKKATDLATYQATYEAIKKATYEATYGATNEAIHRATYEATDLATYEATYGATYEATYGATDEATDEATDLAAKEAIKKATYEATYGATYLATDEATYEATDLATKEAIKEATYEATYEATREAIHRATYLVTYRATREAINQNITNIQQAINACYSLAGNLGIQIAKNWYDVCQCGAYWGRFDSYVTAFRDVLGLKLPVYEKYKFWEKAAIAAPYRLMHKDFCIVSDFPEILKMDDQNRPHCSDGPSHRWRDGWELYYWHGTRIPDEWIKYKSLTPEIALSWPNIEQRRAACEILGWNNILNALDCEIIDENPNDQIGTLLEVVLPDNGKQKFLKVRCGTNRIFAIPVPPNTKSALEAQAWGWGMNVDEFVVPEIRT